MELAVEIALRGDSARSPLVKSAYEVLDVLHIGLSLGQGPGLVPEVKESHGPVIVPRTYVLTVVCEPCITYDTIPSVTKPAVCTDMLEECDAGLHVVLLAVLSLTLNVELSDRVFRRLKERLE